MQTQVSSMCVAVCTTSTLDGLNELLRHHHHHHLHHHSVELQLPPQLATHVKALFNISSIINYYLRGLRINYTLEGVEKKVVHGY